MCDVVFFIFFSQFYSITMGDEMLNLMCLLILLINLLNIQCKSCFIPKSYRIYLNLTMDYNMTIIKNTMNQMAGDEYSNTVCFLNINIDYETQMAEILFDGQRDNSKSDLLLMVTTVVFDGFYINVMVINRFEYICISTSRCHFNFLFENVEWLMDAEYSDLIENLYPLLSMNNQTEGKIYRRMTISNNNFSFFLVKDETQCFIRSGQELEICSSGVCQNIYDVELNEYETECKFSYSRINANFVQIATSVSSSDSNDLLVKKVISHRCEFDQCNSLDILDQIKNVVNKSYNFSLISQIFLLSNREEIMTTKSEYSYSNSFEHDSLCFIVFLICLVKNCFLKL